MSAKIKNKKALSETKLRKNALVIAEAGLAAVDTRQVMREALRLENNKICMKDVFCSLAGVERVFLVGVGKCAHEAAVEIEKILEDRLTGGIVLDVRSPEPCGLKRIKCFRGTHPYPSDGNVSITKSIISLLNRASERDLVIVVVSGGGSTLLCQPLEGTSCIDEKRILEALMNSGASIQEINTIRKHTSLARGGYLASYAYPAEVLGLIFSDISNNDLSMVASGPTVKDATTIKDADRILEKYHILRTCGLEHCGLIETPKDDKFFARVQNVLVASNDMALEAMARAAKEAGYRAQICSTSLTGEARKIGAKIAQEINNDSPKTALIYGGETTVTVRGHGSGGRNQELVLGALPYLGKDILLASIASDGWDNGKHAGALADDMTLKKEGDLNIESSQYLARNDSFNFFKKTGDYLATGHTGSNVADLVFALKR